MIQDHQNTTHQSIVRERTKCPKEFKKIIFYASDANGSDDELDGDRTIHSFTVALQSTKVKALEENQIVSSVAVRDTIKNHFMNLDNLKSALPTKNP